MVVDFMTMLLKRQVSRCLFEETIRLFYGDLTVSVSATVSYFVNIS